MPTWTASEFGKELGRRTKRRREMARDAAFGVAQRGVYEGAVVAERLGVVDRRTYIQRFKAIRTREGTELRNDAPHAAVVEHGRRPGARRPPLGPIVDWVRRKLGKTGPAGRALAFQIARAIGRRGLPAHHIFSRHLVPKLRAWYRAELRKIVATKA